ncbi:MAG: rod shape-determining protein MreC [Actinomycetia bacterium]|nr:rod shape-determining protein MreC [Actinomycetes bacterium]
MGFFNKRFRNIIVLGIIIILCIIVATASFRDSGFIKSGKVAVTDFFIPIQEKLFTFFSPVAGFFNSIRDYINLRDKYLDLQQENQELRQGYTGEINLRIENNALRSMLEMELREQLDLQAARVVGFYQSKWQSEVTLNAGKLQGVEEGMAVITESGLAGKVILAGDRSCRVRLINDPGSSIGARILTSRSLGVAEGSPDKRVQLNYIPRDEYVYNGDIVISSEFSQDFPQELLIGRVSQISDNIGDAYKQIEIEPFADLKSLDYVMVIKGRK